ncbi:actin-like ATPase domain-containing protein, partial [Ophiobolus disseminans]
MEHPRPPPPPSVPASRSSGSVPRVTSPVLNGNNNRESQETRFVIGLDYGTTYSGVAYATPPPGTKCKLDEITVMRDWGTNMMNAGKVPSVISYSPQTDAMEQQWGADLSPNAVSMVHTKLELGMQNVLGELDMTIQVLDGMKNLSFVDMMATSLGHGRPAYSEKAPEDIVSDYLTKVYGVLDDYMDENFTNAFRKLTATDLVVTVPTDWSYMAINSTYRALTAAGFNQKNFPRLQEVMFITESEAAAHYVARFYRDEKSQEFLKENQYFVLCDAGGGTVDVVSYMVKKLRPILQMEQIGKPTGGKCGSIFINRAFLKWLRSELGESYYRELDPNLDIDKDAFHASESPAMRYLMQEFDERKQTFDRDSGDFRLDLPEPLADLTIDGVVNQGEITVTRALMEWFFDTCIGDVVGMIKYHVKEIEKRGASPKNLFLVGGFGASGYLQQQLEFTLNLWNIKFRTPKESWTAIVRGAVVCGIEKSSINSMRRSTFCRHSYAICLDELFSERTHERSDMVETKDNKLAQSQLIWILNEGDVIIADNPRTVERDFDFEFPRSKTGIVPFPIYRHTKEDDEDRPTRFKNAQDELQPACTLEINLSKLVRDCEKNRGWGLTETMCR